jgi:hypothetical protein
MASLSKQVKASEAPPVSDGKKLYIDLIKIFIWSCRFEQWDYLLLSFANTHVNNSTDD